MFSYGPQHMAEKKQDNQLEHTYSGYVRIRHVVLKTCRRRWTIGRSIERGSGISVLAARHDDDDDNDIYDIYRYTIHIYICRYMSPACLIRPGWFLRMEVSDRIAVGCCLAYFFLHVHRDISLVDRLTFLKPKRHILNVNCSLHCPQIS